MSEQVGKIFDAFICHASEDKETIARPLAQTLLDTGLNIWYDEVSLKLGDSLRQSIERGIARSRYGIVILSPSFFEKNWPQAELDGLFSIEISSGKMILPIWHNIGHDELVRHSPIIADRVAVQTSQGLDHVVERILDVIEPDLLHRSKARITVSVEPRSFRLGSGAWAVMTPVVVSNRSKKTVHAVSVKIAIQGGDFRSEDVQIEISDAMGSSLKSGPGSPPISGDAIMLDCIDAEGRQAVLVIFHTIPGQSRREMIVSGRVPAQSTVHTQICDFKMEPAEFMKTPGKVAQIIQAPETMTIKGIRFRVQH